LWQIDYFDWGIGTGLVKVFNTLDDHSRLAVRSRAVLEATGEEAWTTFTQAAATWGLPAGVLSDNGLCFSGKLRGFEVLFEARLRDLGVRPITGRPYHPQTTGKVERFQQTVKKWLRRQPLAADLEQLQAQLDTFLPIYNNERPHQGIGRVTPISRWQAATPVTPPAEPLPHPYGRPGAHLGTVNNSGVLRLEQLSIGLGVEWAGCAATAFIDETHATVFIDGQLVRHLTIDRNRYYQPTRRRRGGPRRPRHLPS
jgi:hypothetical protein